VKGDAAFRTDLTRVSAVMTIEQRRSEETRLVPSVVVIHNPFASRPLPRSFFGRVPQLVFAKGVMRWTDRYKGE
jgi:arginine deiminase